MKLRDITSVIEEYAPLHLQAGFDNSGLAVGSPEDEVNGALLCVDVTEQIIDEAISAGVNLVISHHPLLFHPLRQVGNTHDSERIVRKAIKHDIAIYSAHTNLDSATKGLSYFNGTILGLQDMQILEPHATPETGYGVVGTLAEPMPVEQFLALLKERFAVKVLRHSSLCRQTISRVALSSGSGAYMIPMAIEAGADIFIAADFKYNDFYAPEGRIIAVDMGHFESEYTAIQLLGEIIRKKFPTFALQNSKFSINPVNYL